MAFRAMISRPPVGSTQATNLMWTVLHRLAFECAAFSGQRLARRLAVVRERLRHTARCSQPSAGQSRMCELCSKSSLLIASIVEWTRTGEWRPEYGQKLRSLQETSFEAALDRLDDLRE